jgi:SAM-dependent methyltransferase
MLPVPLSWQTDLGPATAPSPSKLGAYWGERIWAEVTGKTVVDFGCRTGGDALEMVRHGAGHVIGLDIVPAALAVAAREAERLGLADRCTFTTHYEGKADCIICIDAFEHFADPAGVLDVMASILKPGGRVFASFGPPWLHPRGGHSFSVFPWAHLLFTEAALLRWRSDHRRDGARRFEEVEGGLNRMTLARFERLLGRSAFECVFLEEVPIRAARWLHSCWTREWVTSMVRCELRLRSLDLARPRVSPGVASSHC